MRRSILIVMIDVMVLSVLALTAGQQRGGERNIPMPLYRWSSMVEEGLRKEEALRDEVTRLEEQLARAADIARRAMEQAGEARQTVDRERADTEQIQARAHAMELAAAQAQAEAEAARREAEQARQTAAKAEQQADAAAEQTVAAKLAAEQARKEAALARSEGERLKIIAQTAEAARQQALDDAGSAGEQLRELREKLAQREAKLTELQVAEAAARERAVAIAEERERLVAQSEQASEKMVELSGQVAELEVRKETAEQTVAKMEEHQKLVEEELKKSVWVRREESLRTLDISYTEYTHNDRNFVTTRELVMPLVQMGSAVVVPADFRQLGLGRSFFRGLSDRVTEVQGTVRSVAEDSVPLPLQYIVVPGPEPQVCFVRFDGSPEGALRSISMEALKEQRLQSALLFSPGKLNEHGRVEISPLVGSSYLRVRRDTGKKPKVGDYLLTERGEFVGVMVTDDECYVTPQALSREPAPIFIPVSSGSQRDNRYFEEFVTRLNQARDRMDEHLENRRF